MMEWLLAKDKSKMRSDLHKQCGRNRCFQEKSMISVLRPFGEVVAKSIAVSHTSSELKNLVDYLKSLDGETRVVMEHTGRYYEPVDHFLHEGGIFVSAVNPKLIKDYGNNTLRKVKKDKADARKIARLWA